jgi:hypothetical protein
VLKFILTKHFDHPSILPFFLTDSAKVRQSATPKPTEVPGKIIQITPSDTNITNQKKPTAPETTVSARPSPSASNVPSCSDKGVGVRPTTKSFGVQCAFFYCNKCDMYAKKFAEVTDLVKANEPHPVVRTRILQLLRFLRASASGQTDVDHPYTKTVSTKNQVGKNKADHSSKSTQPEQASEISSGVKLTSQKGAGPSRNTTSAQPSNPDSKETGKITSKESLAASSSKTATPSSSIKNSSSRVLLKITPAKANDTKVVMKNTPMSTVATNVNKPVPAKKGTNIDSKSAQPSSKPLAAKVTPKEVKSTTVAPKVVKSTTGPVDKKTPSNNQPKPLKTKPPDKAHEPPKETIPVLKTEPSVTVASPNNENDVKVKLSPASSAKMKTEIGEISQHKPEKSDEVSTAPVSEPVENEQPTPNRSSGLLQRGARSKTIWPIVTRGRGRGRILAARGRGFIPRGRSQRLRFPRAGFNSVSHGEREYIPPLLHIHDYHNEMEPEAYHENSGHSHQNEYFACDFSKDIGPNETIGQFLGPQHHEDPWFGPAPENHGPNFDSVPSREFQPNFHEDQHFGPQFNEEAPRFDAHGPPQGPGPNPHFMPDERGRGGGFRGGRGFCPNQMDPDPMFDSGFRGRPSPRFGMTRARGRPPLHWN